MTREIVAWTYRDDLETIPIADDEDEAMEDWYNDADPEILADPDDVTLYGWARCEWGEDVHSAAQLILDSWADRFEEMWDPDQGAEWTPEVKAAADVLARALLSMEPWACEIVETKEIDAAEWIAKNHPDDEDPKWRHEAGVHRLADLLPVKP